MVSIDLSPAVRAVGVGARRPKTLSTRKMRRERGARPRRGDLLRILDDEAAEGPSVSPSARRELSERQELQELQELDALRPRSRAACKNGPRPCLFVSCRFHLYLDVNEATGSIKLNFPHLEPWELPQSCALDLAERGGLTLEEIGALLNVTRERARQVEESGLAKLRGRT